MRTIKLPANLWEQVRRQTFAGRNMVIPVELDWPELRLTDDQIMANAIAAASGQQPPYPNLAIVAIEVPMLGTEGQP